MLVLDRIQLSSYFGPSEGILLVLRRGSFWSASQSGLASTPRNNWVGGSCAQSVAQSQRLSPEERSAPPRPAAGTGGRTGQLIGRQQATGSTPESRGGGRGGGTLRKASARQGPASSSSCSRRPAARNGAARPARRALRSPALPQHRRVFRLPPRPEHGELHKGGGMSGGQPPGTAEKTKPAHRFKAMLLYKEMQDARRIVAFLMFSYLMSFSHKVPELEKATVRMKDAEQVKKIVSRLKKGGADHLQVISDFDMTLTRFGFNGRRCPTSHNIIDNSQVISEEGKKKLADLLLYYYPIEIDPYRTVEDKLPLMVEWWTKAHSLLSQQKILKSDIAQMVKESDVMLRDGIKVFFDQLYQSRVPLFIFSAGVGDILEEIIRQAGVFHPNVNVVSNYMDFDDHGVLRGFKKPLIHIYNKNNTVLENTEYFQQLCTRTNILLLGDSMGDLSMADGVANVENILRVGFLNDKVEERREKYIEAYDVVLEKDETMDVANGILQFILAKT
uniref:7-methylguanosine phosphate-specific 5'-nucleotidase n=1 Tax=Euleptes europaea TaxID=460621 RepID=UPI002542233E|nr:7-methylguanosine phosphate-specific 5'-nucleotidase [Euleptes europaea]